MSSLGPQSVQLQAGSLSLLYEAGSLRMIRRGSVEIIRMVYAAVRDENWLTVPGRLLGEEIQSDDQSFAIRYRCTYQRDEIDFEAEFTLDGTKDGWISFALDGTAQSAFRKNRIGICVHHPLSSCQGKPCRVQHPNGAWEDASFPDLIAPHQPFRQVRSFSWRPAARIEAWLRLDGDVFETEDQRNWTDASYKTYSTPLERPFPVEVRPSERFAQSAVLQVRASRVPPKQPPPIVTLAPAQGRKRPLPPIGLGQSTENTEYTAEEIAALRSLGLSHLRVEAHLGTAKWSESFAAGVREAALLGLPLEIAAFFGDRPVLEANALRQALQEAPTKSLLLLHRDHKTTPDALTELLLPRLRDTLPGVFIGAGTDAYFAELNRQRPASSALDFLCYSANPQVHAADTRTLVENLAAQGETVRSARAFGGKRAVYVAPVTLKRRRNPDATGPESGAFPNIDSRQSHSFCAGWTLGSLKYLAEAGADSLTYYEASGQRGLFLPSRGDFFPVYYALRQTLADGPASVLPWRSSDPLRVECLALQGPKARKLLAANLTPEPQTVQVSGQAMPIQLPPFEWTTLEMSEGKEGT